MESYADLTPKPANWRRLAIPAEFDQPAVIWLGYFVRIGDTKDPLRCMVSVDLYDAQDKQAGHWLHLSCARGKRTPSWDDLCLARDEMGYKDRLFIKLLPSTAYWLNYHQHCLHLWHRLDALAVPRALWDQEGCDGSGYGKVGVRR